MAFEPRLKKPAYNNKYYISKKTGGYNPCLYGNNSNGQRDRYLNVLPNCVGYTTGRFNEIIGNKECKYLGSTNACNYILLAKKQGLEVGMIPKVGGVMVWTGGDGYGHVGNVEVATYDNKGNCTEAIISQSGWNYKGANCMWVAKHYPGKDGSWVEGGDKGWMTKKKKPYKYAGCIYNPALSKKEEDDEVKLDDFKVKKDGKLVTIKAAIQDGTTIAALKNALETLGYADVSWDEKARMVIIKSRK